LRAIGRSRSSRRFSLSAKDFAGFQQSVAQETPFPSLRAERRQPKKRPRPKSRGSRPSRGSGISPRAEFPFGLLLRLYRRLHRVLHPFPRSWFQRRDRPGASEQTVRKEKRMAEDADGEEKRKRKRREENAGEKNVKRTAKPARSPFICRFSSHRRCRVVLRRGISRLLNASRSGSAGFRPPPPPPALLASRDSRIPGPVPV